MTTYQIEYTGTVNGTRTPSILEYCDSREQAIERMRDMAAWHGMIENLSDDGLYFDNDGDYTRERLTFRAFPFRPQVGN